MPQNYVPSISETTSESQNSPIAIPSTVIPSNAGDGNGVLNGTCEERPILSYVLPENKAADQFQGPHLSKFMYSFFCDENLAIPLKSQFIIIIEPEDSATLMNEINQVRILHANPGSLNWNIQSGTEKIKFQHPTYHSGPLGCIFANSVSIPGENLSIIRPPMQQGFVGGTVLETRSLSNTLNCGFYETSTSFVDLILRPWLIVTTKYGTVAWGNLKIKANIRILEFGKVEKQGVPRPVRKITTLSGCVPSLINEDSIKYSDSASPNQRQVRFSFTNYAVDYGRNL